MRGIWLLKILLILITIRNKRAKPIMIDPGLSSLNKSEIWWVNKQRSLPTAFKLYTGLSLSFSQSFCLLWEGPYLSQDIATMTFHSLVYGLHALFFTIFIFISAPPDYQQHVSSEVKRQHAFHSTWYSL